MTQEETTGLTAEKIQEKINEKLSANNSLTHKVHSKVEKINTKIQVKVDQLHSTLQGNIHTKIHERSYLKLLTGIVGLGLFLMMILLAVLIAKKLSPKPVESCNLSCTLRAAEWTGFNAARVEALGKTSPAAAFDALSAAWVEHHAAEFASGHAARTENARLRDAHERMDAELQDVGDLWKRVVAMKDSPEKADMLKDVIHRSDGVERMAAAVKSGKSFNEVRLSGMTAVDAFEMRNCGDVLRTVGIEACSDDPGTMTGFLRAIGAHDAPPVAQQASSPMWPINKNYPGLKVLDAANGIYVVDNFLTPDECNTLLQSSTTVHTHNRTEVKSGSFAELHSLSKTKKHKSHEHKSREHKMPKRMYGGMPGAFIELDVKGQQESPLKDCKPLYKTSEGWAEVMAPLFEDRGLNLQKCERKGFGDTKFYDVACPVAADTMQDVSKRVSALAQAPEGQIQPMKMLHYGRGDFDLDHHDADARNSNGKVAPMMSVMVYLSSVKGGATYFPNLDLRVEPAAGRALIFPSMTMNLAPVAAALHAEEEVKVGDKWVLGTSVFLGHRDQIANPCAA